MKIPLGLSCTLLFTWAGVTAGQTDSLAPAVTAEQTSTSETPIPLQEYSALLKADPTDDLLAARKANKPDLIPLTAAIKAVQAALDKYRQLSGTTKTLPALDSAEFEFKVTRQVVIGAKLNLWILTIGASQQTQDVNDLTFTYSAPKTTPTPTPTPKTLRAPPQTLQENLVNTIQQAALAAKNDFTWGGLTYAKQIKVHLEYGVDVKFEGGAQIPIYMLTVGPNASWDKNAVQSVTLTFGSSK